MATKDEVRRQYLLSKISPTEKSALGMGLISLEDIEREYSNPQDELNSLRWAEQQGIQVDQPLQAGAPSAPRSLEDYGALSAIADAYRANEVQEEADARLEQLGRLANLSPEEQEEATTRANELEVLIAQDPRGMAGFRSEVDRLRRDVEESRLIQSQPGEFDRRLQSIGAQDIEAKERGRKAEQYFQETDSDVAQTIADVASNLEAGYSLLGGVVGGVIGGRAGPAGRRAGVAVGAGLGSIPMTEIAYNASYAEARRAGVPESESRTFATLMAGSEFVLEALGGKLAGGAGKAAAKDVIKNRLREFTKRTAGAALISGAEEAGTGVIQELGTAGAGAARLGGEEFQAFAEGQLSEDFGEFASRRFREARAGAVLGGAIRAPTAAAEVALTRDPDIDAGVGASNKLFEAAQRKEAPPPIEDLVAEPVQEELFSERETALSETAARQAEAQAAEEAQRLADVETAQADIQTRERARALGRGSIMGQALVEAKGVIAPETVSRAPRSIPEEGAAPVQGELKFPKNKELVTEQREVAKQRRAAESKTLKDFNAKRRTAIKGFRDAAIEASPQATDEQIAEQVLRQTQRWDESNPRPGTAPIVAQPGQPEAQISQPKEQPITDVAPVQEELTEQQIREQMQATLEEQAPGSRGQDIDGVLANFPPDPNVDPVFKEEVAKGTRASSLPRVLDSIAQSPASNRAQRALAVRLSPIIKALRTRLGDVQGIQGPEGKITRVAQFSDYGNIIRSRVANPETLLHEATHAATSMTVNLARTDPESVSPEVTGAIKNLEDLRTTIKQRFDRGQSRFVPRDTFTRTMLGNATGPLSNVDEFMAWGLNNPEFQAYLTSIPYVVNNKPSTGLRAFKEFISNLLGLSTIQKTALDSLIDNTDTIINYTADNVPQINSFRELYRQQIDRSREARGIEPVEEGIHFLEQADPIKQQKADVRSIRDIPKAIVDKLWRWVDPNLGVGQVAKEAMERAGSIPNEWIARAQTMLTAYNQSLSHDGARAVANKDFKTQEEFNAYFEKKINELEGKDDKTRVSMIRALNRDYPQSTQAYLNFRDNIDKMSKEILRLRLADPSPLSTQEKRVYGAIAKNMGRYATRSYAIDVKDVGNKYAKRLLKGFNRFIETEGRSRKDFHAYNTVANAMNYIAETHLVIPSRHELHKRSVDSLRRTYSIWNGGKRANTLGKDTLIDELDELRAFADENIESQAIKEVQNLLKGTNESQTLEYRKGLKQDRTIVTPREAIPDPIRALFGEFSDIGIRSMLTLSHQAQFIGRTKMFFELSKAGLAVPAGIRNADPKKSSWEQLTGETYGPIEGYYVPHNLKLALGDTLSLMTTFDAAIATSNYSGLSNLVGGKAVKTIAGLNSLQKYMNVVLSPFGMAANFGGSWMALVHNGNVDPSTWKQGLGVIHKVAFAPVNKKLQDEQVFELIRNDILDSAIAGELQRMKSESLRIMLDQLSKADTLTDWKDIVTRNFRRGKDTATEFYAMMDVWAKAANYFYQKKVLTKFYALEKGNSEFTQAEMEVIERQAADATKRTNITYSRAIPIIKAIERLGGVQFATYLSETLRVQFTNMFQAVQEVKMAKQATSPAAKRLMARRGVNRVVGQLMATATLPTIIGSIANAVTWGGDEEAERKQRELLPEWAKYQDYLSFGQDENGNKIMLSMSRFYPFGLATDLVRRLSIDDPDYDEIMVSMIEGFKEAYIEPRFLPGLASALLSDTPYVPKSDSKLQKMGLEEVINGLDALPGMSNIEAEAWVRVAESFFPGAANAAIDRDQLQVPKNQGYEAAYAGIKLLGGRFEKYDPVQSIKIASAKFNGFRGDARREFYNYLLKNWDGSTNGLRSKLVELREDEIDAYQELTDKYQGLKAAGYSDRQIVQMLDAFKVSTPDIAAVAMGLKPSRILEEESFKRSIESAALGKRGKEREELKAKTLQALKAIRELGATK